MKSLCVFCGSRSGKNPEFVEIASQLGKRLAEEEIRIIYGGAAVGLMGALAKSCLSEGGKVTSIVPKKLDWESARLKNVTSIIETDDLAERKKQMVGLSDGFVALPGGIGTLDEILEIAAWIQLDMSGIQNKSMWVLNVDGYYNPFREMLEKAVYLGFLPKNQLGIIKFVNTINELFANFSITKRLR